MQTLTVVLVDDLDGSESADVQTVSFGYQGNSYEIDLTPANTARMRQELGKFIAAARSVKPRRQRGTGRTAQSRRQAHDIREWAREHGHQIADRGRIPADVVHQYETAQLSGSEQSQDAPGRQASRTRQAKPAGNAGVVMPPDDAARQPESQAAKPGRRRPRRSRASSKASGTEADARTSPGAAKGRRTTARRSRQAKPSPAERGVNRG